VYETSAGTAERRVEPWHLDFRRGRWSLSAFDSEREDQRNFRLDRIRGDVAIGDAASQTHPAPTAIAEQADPWEFGDTDPVMVSVRFDAEVALFAGDSLRTCDSTAAPDGSLISQVPVTNWPAFRSFVLSFLDHAEILEPPEYRQAMVDWLSLIAGESNG
jgi:predicted DNA-binding transcriptional regulator YafY